ncbi:MAG: hypothetical protein GX185_04335 [Tissierellia bacterium]|nr:hypothetical protein [Tissierellia bacterium]
MLFKSKFERAMKWLREKNQGSNSHQIDEEAGDLDLDKTDILAIIISAIIVFGPIILILFLLTYLISLIGP